MSEQASAPAEGGQGADAAQAAAAEQGAAPPPAFHSSFENPEDRGYVENKGWKANSDLLNSYRNLEKLRGVPAERLATLPESWDDEAQVKAFMERLPGDRFRAPEKADDYGFTAMEGADPTQAQALQEIAFKHGVPPKLASAVMADIMAHEKVARENVMTQIAEETAVELGRLKAKIGSGWDEYVAHGKRAMAKFGITQEEAEAMETNVGAARMFEIWNAVGKQMGEAAYVDGARDKGHTMSKEGAQSERARLMADRGFMARYLNGDIDAKDRMARLNRILAEG